MQRRALGVMRGVLVCLLASAAAVVGIHAQATLIPLNVSLGDVSLNKLIFVIAQEEGLYKKNGLDVRQFITPRAAGVVRQSGVVVPAEYVRELDPSQVPITIGGGSPLIQGMMTDARAIPRVILASTDHMVRWHVVTRPDITAPEQLKGKRIGFSGVGAMTHFMAVVFVKQMGWDPRMDVSLMSNALAVDTLKDGRVDAFIADEVAYARATAAGFKPLVALEQYKVPIAGSGVNAERRWLKDNRDTARRFLKATVEAIALLKNDRQAAVRSMVKWFGMKDPKEQEHFYQEASKLPRKPYPAVDGIKKVMEVYDSHEMRRHKPEDFYDDSIMRELDQSGSIDSLYKTKG